MPMRVPLLVSRSGGEKGYSLATELVSNVRHTATAFSAKGRVDRNPSRCRNGSRSSLPSVAAKCARARWVISFRDFSSLA